MKKILAALALSCAATTAANAVTFNFATEELSIGDFFSDDATLNAGDTFVYNFEAEEDLRVSSFISVEGAGPRDAVEATLVGVDAALSGFDSIPQFGSNIQGESDIPGFVLAAGETFTFTFQNNGPTGSSIFTGLSFFTAPVPLPAGIALLLTAVAGVGIASRRKAAATA